MHGTFVSPTHPGFSGQSQALLQAPTLSIVPGATLADKYIVKDSSGNPVLWATGAMGDPSMSTILIRDVSQMGLLNVSHALGAQVANIADATGQPIGTVMISSKSIKEHKKDKYKDGGKRQVVLQNSLSQPLLTLSGKSKHGGGNMEMKIKSVQIKSHDSDHKDKDKKDKEKKDKDKKDKDKDKTDKDKKDKDKKDKDKKDKDKKGKGKSVGEVTGNLATGFQVNFAHSELPVPEKMNIVGLLIAFMEIEKQGSHPSNALHGPNEGFLAHPYAGQPGIGGMPGTEFPGQHHPMQIGVGQVPLPGAFPPHEMGFVGSPQQPPGPPHQPYQPY